MTRLKLSDLGDDKPVKLSIELSGKLYRELIAYAVALNGGVANAAPAPERLIPAMIERFMATDRSFSKSRRGV